jgi:A/G-specific adenine glycosylase
MDNIDFVSWKLIDWYQLNQRILPWRGISDPYRIWVSEIILQQTRIVQGLDYYLRFIERFPDVNSLADADEQEVLKYWQGLGYYSRARNMHFAAQTIRDLYGGVFPNEYEKVLKLKGIGEYTAAAIVSFAWDLPYPVVDGNVFRFLSRLFLIDEPIDTPKGKKQFTELAGSLMDQSRPALFNQAIMEFGALQCVPSSPDCRVCPFESNCFAYKNQCVPNFPVKQNKTKTKDLYLFYFHIHFENYTYIYKRVNKGIWQNLFEFPVIESEKPIALEQLIQGNLFSGWFPPETIHSLRTVVENKKHILSHRILHASFIEIFLDKKPDSLNRFIQIQPGEMDKYPVHRLMQYYFTDANISFNAMPNPSSSFPPAVAK